MVYVRFETRNAPEGCDVVVRGRRKARDALWGEIRDGCCCAGGSWDSLTLGSCWGEERKKENKKEDANAHQPQGRS